MKSRVGHICIFPTILCRVDLVSNLQTLQVSEGDSQGLTVQTSQIEASRISHLFLNIPPGGSGEKIEKTEEESK